MKKSLYIAMVVSILVLIGIGVFFIVRNYTKSAETLPDSDPNPDQPQEPITLTDGRQCYTYSHEATPDAPYTTSEFIDITISGNAVTGTKKGTQAGPDMTNGYTGTITGTLVNNRITDIYSYVIEGSAQKEQEMFQAGLTGIDKLRYPLVEKNGVLVPDTSKDFTIYHYARVGCEGSN